MSIYTRVVIGFRRQPHWNYHSRFDMCDGRTALVSVSRPLKPHGGRYSRIERLHTTFNNRVN